MIGGGQVAELWPAGVNVTMPNFPLPVPAKLGQFAIVAGRIGWRSYGQTSLT
jgi:hypothetical protein